MTFQDMQFIAVRLFFTVYNSGIENFRNHHHVKDYHHYIINLHTKVLETPEKI